MLKIDTDTHFTPIDAFDAVDPAYTGIAPHFVKLPDGKVRVVNDSRDKIRPEHLRPIRQAGHDPREFAIGRRLDAMAQCGFDMQVLIPSNSPFYYDIDPKLGASVCRSFNKATGRILKDHPKHFIGTAPVPLQDVPLAIGEMEYAIKGLGIQSVIIYQNVNGKDLDSEFLWPFYERAEELEIPLLVHGCDSGPLLGVERYARFNLDVCLGFPFEIFMAIATLIFGGVVERFPKLRFGFFEVGVGFIAWLIDRLETAYDSRPAARGKISKRPKNSFDNFFFSLGADDSTLPDVVKRIGSDRLMVGSDYPHSDGTYPHTIQMIESNPALSEKDRENLLGGVAASFFSLDRR
jgi:aminocarboxymuconate-semialdehyde decarboxylase